MVAASLTSRSSAAASYVIPLPPIIGLNMTQGEGTPISIWRFQFPQKALFGMARRTDCSSAEEEQIIFDIAASVAQCAKECAFDRLFHLSQHGTTQ
jgi:hypothetical protein